jgi:hypothetical protein
MLLWCRDVLNKSWREREGERETGTSCSSGVVIYSTNHGERGRERGRGRDWYLMLLWCTQQIMEREREREERERLVPHAPLVYSTNRGERKREGGRERERDWYRMLLWCRDIVNKSWREKERGGERETGTSYSSGVVM